MAKDFTLVYSPNVNFTKSLAKGSSTVIEEGDAVALSSGLAVKADATSTKIAIASAPGANGETTVTVYGDKNNVYSCTADAAFAVTDRGAVHDIVISGSTQLLDIGTSSTNVLKVEPGADAGTAASASGVLVTINALI